MVTPFRVCLCMSKTCSEATEAARNPTVAWCNHIDGHADLRPHFRGGLQNICSSSDAPETNDATICIVTASPGAGGEKAAGAGGGESLGMTSGGGVGAPRGTGAGGSGGSAGCSQPKSGPLCCERRQGSCPVAALACGCQSSTCHLIAKQVPALTVLLERAHQRPGSQGGRLRARCGRGFVGVPDRALVHRGDLCNSAGDRGAGLRADGLRLRERRCTGGSQPFMPSTASEQGCWGTISSLQGPLRQL